MKTLFRHIKNNDGSIINIALTMLLLMSSMGISATTTTTDDVKIAANYKYDRAAFFDAYSGIQYGLTKMENDLKAETLTFPSPGSTVNLTYTVPTNFSFGLSSISRNATNLYSFSANGAGPKNATAAIETVFMRRISPATPYAAFGDGLVDMKANAEIYSYDSRDIPNPTPGDTGNESDVGSNKEVKVKNGTEVNGDVVLGKQTDGTPGIITEPPGSGAVYDGPVNIGRVDPDPLGVVGGDYASKFSTYSTSNDNGSATSTTGTPIVGNVINLGNGENITLIGKPGGANYYLSRIDLGNSATLNVNASAGPVNIFLTGALNANNNAIINNNGLPTDFTVFSNSNQLIGIHHGGVFKGLIYAPYATVELKNSAALYGAIWAETVDLKNSGEVYFDVALKDPYRSNDLNVVSWRQLQ